LISREEATGREAYRTTSFGTLGEEALTLLCADQSESRDQGRINILVKRGKEWHGPDSMILNEKSIVLVEPVGAGSKVDELINESRR
jgi:hypothetical protein